MVPSARWLAELLQPAPRSGLSCLARHNHDQPGHLTITDALFVKQPKECCVVGSAEAVPIHGCLSYSTSPFWLCSSQVPCRGNVSLCTLRFSKILLWLLRQTHFCHLASLTTRESTPKSLALIMT